MSVHRFCVGTFNTRHIYTLAFDTETSKLAITGKSDAIGSHSWLAYSPNKRSLYATAWTTPPSVVAYRVGDIGSEAPLTLLNTKQLSGTTRSGYVCATDRMVYSVGGTTGDVFEVETDGRFKEMVQSISFEDASSSAHRALDFGGLRHGAHSVDLAPNGRALYVADLGNECIWAYHVRGDGSLEFGSKTTVPREGEEGPRHTWPHPSGKILYCVEEHSSMVDTFGVAEDGVTLQHLQAVRIIPKGKDAKLFWADEVRVSLGPNPKYLYATVRGLESKTKGYVSVFALDESGRFASLDPLAMWETPTSGGWANAIEPGPAVGGVEYLALTDSEEGLVMILSWDGKSLENVARVSLDPGAGAATAVWYD